MCRPKVAFDLAHNVWILTLSHQLQQHLQQLTFCRSYRPAVRPEAEHVLSLYARHVPGRSQGSSDGVRFPVLSRPRFRRPGTQQLGHVTYVFNPTMLAEHRLCLLEWLDPDDSARACFLRRNHPISKSDAIYPNTVGVVPTLCIGGMTTLGGGVASTWTMALTTRPSAT